MATKDNSAVLDFRRFGYLAYVYSGARLELEVLETRAGFYVGTVRDDMPCSRESNEYYPSNEAALEALVNDTWTQKVAP